MNEPLNPQKMKRKRGRNSLVACDRCKARKQKCSGDFRNGQKCSQCENSGSVCHYDEQKTPNYTRILQNKIEYLEQKLKDLQEDRKNGSPKENKGLLQCAALIPLKNDSEPLYVGSFNTNVADLVQSYLSSDIEPESAFNNWLEKDDSMKSLSDINSRQLEAEFERITQDELLTEYYFDNYLSLVQLKYPFLELSMIELLKNNKFTIFHLRDSTLEKYFLCMIYAIGSHLRPTNNGGKLNHLIFYKMSSRLNLQAIFKQKSITNVQAILLQVVYKLRFPNGVTIWFLISLAIRLCIDLGMHRRNLDLFVTNPYAYQVRTRTFWSAYFLERTISDSFGRPYTISDRDIDLDLPINVDEATTDYSTLKTKFYQTYPQHNTEGYPVTLYPETNERTSLSLCIQYFKLRQIDSKIQRTLYRVDKEFEQIPRDKIAKLQKLMKIWIDEMPPFFSGYEYDYCLYLFNKQIRNLTIPFINKLGAEDALFIECMKSSITVCKLHKRILKKNQLISFIGLQTIFLSGITIIYGLLSKKIKWDFDTSEGLRCCSEILLLIGDRCPSCAKYSDTFEKLFVQVSQQRYSKDNDLSLDNHNSPYLLDMFGQDKLKSKVDQSHYENNMSFFNEITNYDYMNQNKDFDELFNFSDLNLLFKKLGDLNSCPSDVNIELF